MHFPCAIVIHQVPILRCKLKTCLMAKPPITKPPFVNSRAWEVGCGGGCVTGVCEQNTPFKWTSALQSRGRNCSPAPDLALCRLYLSKGIIFWRSVFSQTPVGILYYSYYTILYYTILYYTILYYTILYDTILYYTILHYTTLHCTTLYARASGRPGGGSRTAPTPGAA